MRYILITLLLLVYSISNAQVAAVKEEVKKLFKFSTFYAAVNGGTSVSDRGVYSISTGSLEESLESTPDDYTISFGLRKIARFGYENKANTFYDGTENSWSDAATIGKVKGLEFLFEFS